MHLCVHMQAHMLLDCQDFHVQFIMEEKMNKEQSEHSNRFKMCTKTAHYFLAVEKSHNNLAERDYWWNNKSNQTYVTM